MRVGDRYLSDTIRDYDGFYANLMRNAAAFFRTGQPQAPVEEALMTVAILEGALRSQQAGGKWINLGSVLP